MCGVDERGVAFLLTDSQIVNDVFLEDICNILNSGEVPGKDDEQKGRGQDAIPGVVGSIVFPGVLLSANLRSSCKIT